jgi:hypothetical protein
MGLWIVSGLLLLGWAVAVVIFHKSGFIHILLLCAIAVIVVQLVAERRAV